MTRLAPRQPPYPEPVAGALSRLMGGAAGLEPLALFRTIAHHEPLLERFRQIGSTLLSFGTLDPAERELVVHRTTARCGAAYEWGVHAALFAPAVGKDEAWLRATWSGGPDAFEGRERTLVRMCDELHDAGTLSDATSAALAAGWSDEQRVELVCLAGFYHLVSFCCGAFALEPEPWAVNP